MARSFMAAPIGTGILVLLAVVAICVGPGCRRPALPEPTPKQDLGRLVALERLMLEALDETGVDWEASLAESSLIAKKLLVIRDGLEVHEAVDVYFCKKPEAVHECRFVHADDTVHTTEFPERYVPIVVTPDTVLSLFCPAPACPAKHRLMMGDPFAMHVAGHGAAVSVPVSVDGTMDLAALPAGKEMLLFTLVKTGAEELYRKYVWVVTKR